jgi:hypothetical protein
MINVYLEDACRVAFDDLPKADQRLISHARSLRGLATMMQLDAKTIRPDSAAAMLNISNMARFPVYDAWYREGIYAEIRDNYSKILREQTGNQHSSRIEIYSQSAVRCASQSDRYWSLLHLWEECILNRTKMYLLDIDSVQGTLRNQLADLDIHLLWNPDATSALFRHAEEFEYLANPKGECSLREADEAKAVFHDRAILRLGRLADLPLLRELCREWQDEALADELACWERLRVRFGVHVMDEILAPFRESELVTISEISRRACLSPRTLERHLPKPDVPGAGRSKALWQWDRVAQHLLVRYPERRKVIRIDVSGE